MLSDESRRLLEGRRDHMVFTTGTRIPDPPFFLIWSLPRLWYGSLSGIFEPFIHILQHFVLQLSRSTNFCF